MGKIFTLDLSTNATGWALFDIETGRLVNHGLIKSKTKAPQGSQYPKTQLYRAQDIAQQIRTDFVDRIPDLQYIVIEEINRGVSRLAQKTLDGLHYIVLDRLDTYIDIVRYMDSDGPHGWRTHLGLFLTDADKIKNDQARKINKKLAKGQKKYPIINKKHLACRYVNSKFGRTFNYDLHTTDADQADAIGLGVAFLERRIK